MTKSAWFDDLELLSRRSAWERGQFILSQHHHVSATVPLIRQRMATI
jgi:hypothetical protein